MTNVSGYIDAPIVYDPQSMAQAALNNLMNAIPGWSPREGNLDVLLVEEFAQMASEAASAASSVPSSIFKYYGDLVGITQNTGAQATIQTQWTLVAPTSSFTVPAGTIAGFYWQGTPYQYQTLVDVTFTSPVVTQTIVMQAVSAGYNYGIDGLGIPGTVSLSTTPANPYIAGIVVTGTPGTNSTLTLGVDAETDSSYLNRLASELALLAPRPITPNDFAQMAQNVVPTYRAAAVDGINPYGNLLTNNDANLTTAIINNYVAVGNGTATLPTLALTGGALQMTAASMPSSTTSTTAVTTSSTSVTVSTAVLDASVSAINPAIVLVSDTATMTATTTLGSQTVTSSTTPVAGQLFTGPGIPAGTTVLSVGSGTFTISNAATSATSGGKFTYGFGNEIVVITSVSGTSWSLATGTKFAYPHASGVTLTLLQGAKVPNVTNISSNTPWIQSAATIQCGSDTTSTVRPYVVSVATYYDGSTKTFSSQLPLSDGLYDYTTNLKTVFCNINAVGDGQLAPASTQYASLRANVTSIQSYIVFGGAASTKTHKIFYTALQPSSSDFTNLTGRESVTYSGSDGNYIPDANLLAWSSSSATGSSWILGSGLNALPGIGIQLVGTGSALGSAANATSQSFNMPNIAGTQFTAYGSVDMTYATAGTVTLNVMQVGNATPLGSAVASTIGQVNNLVVNFTIPNVSGSTAITAYDLYVQVVFSSTLNIASGSSVVTSNLGLIIGNYTTYQSILTFGPDPLYTWYAGGLYSVNTFNYSRTVALAPITSTGATLSVQQAENVVQYLSSRREINFNVFAIQPNYVPINVSWSAVCLPGFDPNTVQAAGNTAIQSLLSPANWAGGLNTPPYWDTTRTTVRVLDIAGVISQVSGVATVSSVTLSAGVSVGTLSSNDVAMTGLAPLPVANYITGSVITNGTNSTIGGI